LFVFFFATTLPSYEQTQLVVQAESRHAERIGSVGAGQNADAGLMHGSHEFQIFLEFFLGKSEVFGRARPVKVGSFVRRRNLCEPMAADILCGDGW
jgi:hypothetical protein